MQNSSVQPGAAVGVAVRTPPATTPDRYPLGCAGAALPAVAAMWAAPLPRTGAAGTGAGGPGGAVPPGARAWEVRGPRTTTMVVVMRQSGLVADVRRLGPHDHVCWSFADSAEFRAAAVDFLGAGLAMGQRVRYVGTGADEVRAALPDVRPGAFEVVPVETAYPTGGASLDPGEQVEGYAAATADALAAGFTGLRVAADITVLADRPAGAETLARYEHQVDRLMVRMPMSAMCAYDRTVVDETTLAGLMSMHPGTGGAAAPFRLYASSTPGCAATLAGELDVLSLHQLEHALERAAPQPVAGELTYDATDLAFIDWKCLATLSGHARRHGATLVLRTGQPVPLRLVRLLGWEDVRTEAP